jgi:hypothetical protein
MIPMAKIAFYAYFDDVWWDVWKQAELGGESEGPMSQWKTLCSLQTVVKLTSYDAGLHWFAKPSVTDFQSKNMPHFLHI